MRALPEEIRVLIVELLLSGWSITEIVESGVSSASQPTITRIAKCYGLSPGKKGGRRDGAGRPKGSNSSGHRDAVLALRSSGLTWQQVATELGLKSRQHAQKLGVIVDGGEDKAQ
jgi:hypothetical protein